jgi:DNA-binding transcriptional MocR family regulator
MEDPKRQKKRMSVVQALKAGIADGSLLDGNNLLPVRTLAKATHTSPVTALRALAVLRVEGVLAGKRKCRPRIAAAEHAGAQRVPHPRRSWQVAREHIARLVLTSHYGEAANLLSAKEFAGSVAAGDR